MQRFILYRLAWALPAIAVILVVNFLLTHIIPGDPIDAIVGEYPVPPAYVAEVRHTFGLDQPLYVQLGLYLFETAKGNLGFSFSNRQDVLGLVLSRAGATLQLMVPALIGSSLLGIVLARIAALRQGKAADLAVTGLSLFAYSVPVFWLGQLLIVFFSVDLHWLPATGMHAMRGVRPGFPQLWDFAAHWAMPGICTMLFYSAIVMRISRASLQETLDQDFVVTARAKGLAERRVFWRHVFPNAMVPIVTVIGYNFGYVLTGAILVETAFSWPGLGTLFLSSIGNRDYPVLQAIFLFSAVVVVLANLAADVAYGLVDPRVRRGSVRTA
jgi:peptide/nickel transport system permease protein